MLFWLPIRIGRYTLHIHFLPYGNTGTQTVLRGPGWTSIHIHTVLRIRRPSRLGRWFWRIRWLPILRPEYLSAMAHAESLGELNFPLPFRILAIEIYRRRPDTAARG